MPCIAFFGRRGVLTNGFWAASMLVGAFGCASTADDSEGEDISPVDTSNVPDVPDEAPPANTVDNGQTGSIGSSECQTDADCERIAQSQLDDLGSPQPSGISLQARSCEVVNIIGIGSALSCGCATDSGGLLFVGLDCARLGRTGACIYPGEEFPGCTEGDAASCDAVCSDLEQRIAEDAAAAHETELRSATCESGSCQNVVRVDDQCFVNQSYALGKSYDCSLSDEALIAAHAESLANGQPVPCSELDPAVGGTCYDDSMPQYHPRDPREWQGMLIDVSIAPPCDESARCGLARACIDGQCLPCETDEDCAAGEGCALDHCVLLSNLACRTYADCAEGALCILSGYTGGTARGNEDMRAYCLSASGGTSMP